MPLHESAHPTACQNARTLDPLDKRLLFVTGKGGVGKTTVSYALGLAAAAAGKRVIVCETSAQDRGARLFGQVPRGFSEEELTDGLWTISIGFEEATKDYLERQMPVRSMGSILARSNIFTYLAAATPGLQEMVTMGKIWEIAHVERRKKLEERIYDLIIVDAPATGHGISFLRTPGEFQALARVGPLAKQAGRIAKTLVDHDSSGVVIVATPEEMAVSEAILLEESLAGKDGTGFAIDRHYVNGLHPIRFTDRELGLIESAGEGRSKAALATRPALAESARASTQREQLRRLEQVTKAPVTELPYLYATEIGPEELAHLAEEVG